MNTEAVMKSPIIALPVLIQIAVVAALYVATTAPAPTPLPSNSANAIHDLRQQRDEIETRLADLESRTRVFLPRGMGETSVPRIAR
jgi:hypothetical protein